MDWDECTGYLVLKFCQISYVVYELWYFVWKFCKITVVSFLYELYECTGFLLSASSFNLSVFWQLDQMQLCIFKFLLSWDVCFLSRLPLMISSACFAN